MHVGAVNEDLAVGYWDRTASVDWSEPNYVYTPYVAEFWNALSSIPVTGFAFLGLCIAIRYKYETKFIVSYLLIMIVGLGSFAFHATLTFSGQMLDELPMIYASMSLLYTVLRIDEPQQGPSSTFQRLLGPVFTLYCIAFTLS
jgi:dihydroceramidase